MSDEAGGSHKIMANHKPQLPARVHPDDRKRIEGLKTLGTLIQGAPQTKAPLSYYTPILIQCTLPHSDPKTPSYAKTNGDFSLIVSSGFDRDGKPYGVPYGSLPRLVLAYIITRVIETGERYIDLSSHFSGFMKEIGYTGNLRGNSRQAKSVHNQLIRLLLASIRFEISEGTAEKGQMAGVNINIADEYRLWWNFRKPEQDSLWGSHIEISEKFRKAILSAPLPLRTDILKVHRKSPLVLDVYMWVSYRLFVMQSTGQESIALGYGRLQEQFGTGIGEKDYRKFRSRLKDAFVFVDESWRTPDGEKQSLNYEFEPTRLILYRSPLLVQAKPTPAQEAARRILESRSFDEATRRKARQLAGKWDVPYLTSQYFEWIEHEGIAPKDPRAHFLDFIKTHRQRHGETV
jgi:Plasmid encoded RepA protein